MPTMRIDKTRPLCGPIERSQGQSRAKAPGLNREAKEKKPTFGRQGLKSQGQHPLGYPTHIYTDELERFGSARQPKRRAAFAEMPPRAIPTSAQLLPVSRNAFAF